MSDQNIVVYTYTPANEGDHIVGVPARDLTVLDVAQLSPRQLRNMLSPGPSGKAMYTASDDENEHAAAGRTLQEKYAPKAEKAQEAVPAKVAAKDDADEKPKR